MEASSKSFEEGWSSLQIAVDKLISQIEGDDNSVGFTPEEYMSYYTIVYELCSSRQQNENPQLLYDQYKKVFEEYINSTVLPSLRGKKGELLLTELHRRWSNHKIMTNWLSKIFNYLESHYLPRQGLPSLEESSFSSFYDLVYDEMSEQIKEAILPRIDQERAGEQTDETLVNNALGIYEGNSPKKVSLESSDGFVFEVDCAAALLSKTINHIIKLNPDVNTIPLPRVSRKILAKVIEYCKKHTEASQTLDVDLKDWDADFVKVDQVTLFDLILSANYLNVKSLLDLATQTVADMIKGKTPEEIRKTFSNSKNVFTLEEEEEIKRENQWAFE